MPGSLTGELTVGEVAYVESPIGRVVDSKSTTAEKTATITARIRRSEFVFLIVNCLSNVVNYLS